jgi:molybdate transport system substrate-binding protein
MGRRRGHPLAGLLMLTLAVVPGCDRGRDASTNPSGRVRVAVASNFLRPMRLLARAFQAETGVGVVQSAASTGKLYAQIRAGAPFDVFLAADAERPERLVEEGLAHRSSLRRYATGRLVLIAHANAANSAQSPGAPDTREGAPHEAPLAGEATTRDDALPPCLDRILGGDAGPRRPVAIANPATAPYGRAARQTLQRLGLWTSLAPHLVRGENVAQTLHFVESGNAAAGFVAASQLIDRAGVPISSCRWAVPEALHDPIEQRMVVLERAVGRPEVEAFARFMASEPAARIIRAAGYAP